MNISAACPPCSSEQMGEQIAASHETSSQANIERLEMALAETENGMHQVDMPDAVRHFKSRGRVEYRIWQQIPTPLRLLDRAIAYDERVGAKQLRKRSARRAQ